MFRRNIRDAHLRYYAIAMVIALPALAVAFLVRDPILFLVLLLPHFLLTFPSMGYASTLVQLVTPPDQRSRVSSLFLLVMNLISLGFGAVVVGALSQAYGGKGHLGPAILTVLLVCGPVAFALVIQALRPARELLAAE